MLLHQLFESNYENHGDAWFRTGFWGAQGAGCIFVAKDTGRFLLAHRSQDVEQPGTWGVWGGAIDSGENPSEAALREAEEESGYSGHIKLVPMYVFQKGSFRYSNFLAIIDKEFSPRLDWETQDSKWCQFGKWPKPLHFGVQAILADPHSVKIMKKAASSNRTRTRPTTNP